MHNRDHITNVGEVEDTGFQVEEYDNGESGTTDDKEPPTKTKKKEKRTFRWRNREPLQNQIDFLGTPYPLPEKLLEPIDYFRMFWSDDITTLISEQTNLYSVQASGSNVKTTPEEIEQFIGMNMMGIFTFPRFDLYWAERTRYAPIADVMPIRRYKKIRQYLHVIDNTTKDEPTNKQDKLFLETVWNNSVKVLPETVHSIDEQIIPVKTKLSGIRQYCPKKTYKMGF